MNFNGILKSTIITEKTSKLMEEGNRYTFQIARNSTKGQVKEAVEKLYGVSVKGVKVLNTGGKVKRSWSGKKTEYSRSPVRKAIVELKDGDTLKVYEGS